MFISDGDPTKPPARYGFVGFLESPVTRHFCLGGISSAPKVQGLKGISPYIYQVPL